MRYAEHNQNPVDFGPEPFVVNIARATQQNPFYRRTLWTGCHLQLTLMCIPPCGEIGLEVHPDNDQFLRLEEGQGIVMMGACRERLNFQRPVCQDDAIFVPGGNVAQCRQYGENAPQALCYLCAAAPPAWDGSPHQSGK